MNVLSLDQNLIYIVIFIFIALVLLLIGLLVSYARLITKYLDVKERRRKGIDPHSLLANANLRSQKILEDAHNQARVIISKADSFLTSEEASVAKELVKVNQTYTKYYQEALESLKTASTKMLGTLPQDVKILMISAVDNFRVSLQQELVKAQREASESFVSAFKSSEEEIEKYKKERQRQIDEQAVNLVSEVIKRVLGKEISLDEHEKLVLRALEEAKRQGIL